MVSPTPVTHVIFDVDGLLIDTESIYTQIMNSICEPYNKKFTWDIKVKQMGKKERESAQVLIDECQLPITVDEYVKRVQHLQNELMPTAKLLPGAEKLVLHLHKHQIPIAVASGSDAYGYGKKTSRHTELFSLFHHIVLSSSDPDVTHGKPAPDCFLVAAKRFPDSPPPEKCLVFEDAPNGAEAGVAAGMQTVWIPDPNINKAKDNLDQRVTQVLESLDQFKPELYGLPPYDV